MSRISAFGLKDDSDPMAYPLSGTKWWNAANEPIHGVQLLVQPLFA